MPKLQLYIAHPCPFCIRVTDFIEQNNIDSIEIIDTNWDRDKHLDLQSKYGKTMVPLLLIDGEPMYESILLDYYLS